MPWQFGQKVMYGGKPGKIVRIYTGKDAGKYDVEMYHKGIATKVPGNHLKLA